MNLHLTIDYKNVKDLDQGASFLGYFGAEIEQERNRLVIYICV